MKRLFIALLILLIAGFAFADDRNRSPSVQGGAGIESDPYAVKKDGTVSLTALWDAGSYQIRAESFYSDVATGTAPFTIASTTLVSNLNAQYLNGQASSYFAAVADVIKKDGTVGLTSNWDVGSYTITAPQFISDIATGTAPFTVASTTLVNNLNANYLGGNAAAYFAADNVVLRKDATTALTAPWLAGQPIIADFYQLGRHGYDIRGYSATPDDGTNDRTPFSDTDTAAGANPIIVPRGVYDIDTSLTITSLVDFDPSGIIDLADGATLTLSGGQAIKDLTQHYSRTTTGTVAFAAGHQPELRPEWFGGRADNSTDNLAAIQWCLDICNAAGGGTVLLSAGTYVVSGALLIDNSSIKIIGEGDATIFRLTGATDLFYLDNSESVNGLELRDFQCKADNAACDCVFDANGTGFAGSGWVIDNVDIQRIDGADAWNYGFRFKNIQSSSMIGCSMANVTGTPGTVISLENTSNAWSFTGLTIGGTYNIGIDLQGTHGLTVNGGTYQGVASDTVIKMGGTSDSSYNQFHGIWIENVHATGNSVEINGGDANTFFGGQLGSGGLIIVGGTDGVYDVANAFYGVSFGVNYAYTNTDAVNTLFSNIRTHQTTIFSNETTDDLGTNTVITGSCQYNGAQNGNTIDVPTTTLDGTINHTAGSLTASSSIAYTIPELRATSGVDMDYHPGGYDENLVFLCMLDEGAGSVAYDASNNDFDGTITTPAWATGAFGKPVFDNDGTGVITIADNASNRLGTSDFTLEAYVKLGTDTGGLIQKGDTQYGDGNFQLQKETATLVTLKCEAEDTVDYVPARMTITANDVVWNHIVYVKSGRDLLMYLNGALYSTATDYFIVGADFTSTNDWKIMNGTAGDIAYCAVYTRVLSLTEIRSNWLRLNALNKSIVCNDNFRVIGSDGAVDFSMEDGAATFAGEVVDSSEDFIPVADFSPTGDGSSNSVSCTRLADGTNRRMYNITTGGADTQDMDWYAEKAVKKTPTSLTLYVRASDYANCVVTMTVSDVSGNADATGAVVITPSANATWQEKTYTLTSTYTNDEELWIKIAITSLDTADTVSFGRMKINY